MPQHLQDHDRQVRAQHGPDHQEDRKVGLREVQARAQELLRQEGDLGRRCRAGQAVPARRPDRGHGCSSQEGHRQVEEASR